MAYSLHIFLAVLMFIHWGHQHLSTPLYSVHTVHIVQVHLRLSPDILQRDAGREERHLQGPHVRHPCHPHLHPHQHSQVPRAEAGLRGGRDWGQRDQLQHQLWLYWAPAGPWLHSVCYFLQILIRRIFPVIAITRTGADWCSLVSFHAVHWSSSTRRHSLA